jgi:uncharacterized protein involved in exopolysaccharide biosynthesis
MREDSNQQGQGFQGKAGEDRYDEVDLFDYIEVLVKRRWLIFFGVLVCVLTTFIYTSRLKQAYKAEATVLPAEQRDFLANLLGRTETVARKSFYLDILKSVPVGKAVVEKTYAYVIDGKKRTGNLMECFQIETIGRALRALEDIADFEEARTTSVITISATTASPELSAAIANEYVEQLKIYNMERRKTQTGEQLEFIKKRLAEVKKELEKAEENLTQFKERNRSLIASGELGGKGISSFSSPQLSMELSRLQREVTIKSGLFETLTRQYELVRIEAKKEIPVIEVLNYAEPPERPVGRGRKVSLLISFVVGGFVAVFLAFFLEYLEKMRLAGRMNFVSAELKKDRKRILRLLGKRGT